MHDSSKLLYVGSPLLQVLAQRLRGARRPLVLVGRGVLWSKTWTLVHRLAAALPQLRVATTPGAKGCFPDASPQSVGVCGFGGSSIATKALMEADLVLVLGSRLLEQSSLDWNDVLGKDHVYRFDVHARYLAATWAAQVAVEGELDATLSVLASYVAGPGAADPTRPLAAHAPKPPSTERAEEHPLNPRTVMELLRPLTDIPICADAGNAMCWAIEYLPRDVPETFYVSLDWGTMGFALPLAIGLTLAKRRHIIALTGDGSVAMVGGELHTAVENHLPVIVVALNDSGAGMVRAGTAQWFPCEAELPGLSYARPLDLAAFAISLGAQGIRATTTSELTQALSQALSHYGPTLIDVIISRTDVPPAISNRVSGLAQGGGIC